MNDSTAAHDANREEASESQTAKGCPTRALEPETSCSSREARQKGTEAEVTWAGLQWTTERPQKNGWYFFKGKSSGYRAIAVEVTHLSTGNWQVLYLTGLLYEDSGWNGKWAGPIPLPYDPDDARNPVIHANPLERLDRD